MTYFKLAGALAAFALLATPALAQVADQADLETIDQAMDSADADHSKMDMPAMDHSKMDHSNHDQVEAAETETVTPVAADAEIITAKVNGLVCDFCAQSLRKVFKKQDAVDAIKVDLDSGEVKVTLKPGGIMDDETLGKLIRKSGYSLVNIERAGGAS